MRLFGSRSLSCLAWARAPNDIRKEFTAGINGSRQSWEKIHFSLVYFAMLIAPIKPGDQ